MYRVAFGLNTRIHLADRLLDDGGDDGDRARRNSVLQRRECLDVRILQDAGAHRRRKLSDLHVDSAEVQNDVDGLRGNPISLRSDGY